MVEKKQLDKDEKNLEEYNSPLELKDWISFLNSESYQDAQTGLLFLTIAIALYAIISIENYGPLLQWALVILMMMIFVVATIIMNHGFVVKKCLDKIIERIIDEELTDSKEIREQWKKCKKPLFSKRK